MLGPLIGADLLHLRDILNISTAIANIGSAGMFDAIMRSGVVAPYLASATFLGRSDQPKTIRRLLAMQNPTEAVMDWGRRPHNYSLQHRTATKKPATSHMFSLSY